MRGPKKIHLILSVLMGALVVLALGAVAVFSLIFSNMGKEIKIEQQKLALEEERERSLIELGKNLQSLQNKYDLISKTVPDNKDVSRLVAQIEGLLCAGAERPDEGCITKSITFGAASAVPVELKSFALKDPALSQSFAKGDLYLLAMSVNLETSYSNFYRKLKDIENFSRYLHVSNILMQPERKRVNVTLDMYTYYLPNQPVQQDQETPTQTTEEQ